MSSRHSVVVRLQPTAEAPARARATVREVCRARYDEEFAETVELMTSELVTNAVLHGEGLVTVAVECGPGGVAVAVGDKRPTPPACQPLDAGAPAGRGLHVVNRLAQAWGVREGDGTDAAKVVWFVAGPRTAVVI